VVFSGFSVSSTNKTEHQNKTEILLKMALNTITKIWPGMTIERASQKSLRITATDSDEGVKVFLIAVSIVSEKS
jgi:hypothetical protein